MGPSSLLPSKSSSSIIPLLFLLIPALPSLVAAEDSCFIETDGVKFDFGPLRGPSSVTVREKTPPTTKFMTWTIDPCGPLKYDEDKKDEMCPKGSHVCGIERSEHPDKLTIERIIPIAGDFGDDHKLSPKYTRLKTLEDSSQEGVRVEMSGGVYPSKEDGKEEKQKAVVTFICDKDKTGLEGQDRESHKENVGGMDNNENQEKSLKFVSYEGGVLKLEWRTKYACEKQEGGGGSDTDEESHWGFFTWFIIILFMGTAAYLIFGSWLNYNRYGARGWDLLPHGDTIRDLPYLLKDYIRKIVQTLQGRGFGGSRAGYSAV